MSRTAWTEEMIEQGIRNAIKSLDIERMPSRSEIEGLYGNSALANKISKTGGFYYWAKKLKLDIKKSETKSGYNSERMIKELLENKGYKCEMTSTRHPYDILVDGCVKIDVKSARKTKVRDCDVYSFGLAKKHHTCDVYVAVCLDDETVEKIYVIPAHVMTSKSQLCLGVKRSKYDRYIDKWEVIEDIAEAFKHIA